jgi:hypothetical protein
MLITPVDFLKNFLWKYVEISVTNADVIIIKHMFCSKKYTDKTVSFIYKFDCLKPETANIFVFILLQIDKLTLHNFLKFFIVQHKKLHNCHTIQPLASLQDLNSFIDTEHKLELLIYSIYQYF